MAAEPTDLPGAREPRHLHVVGTPLEEYPSAAKLIKRTVRCQNPNCLAPDLPASLGVRPCIAVIWKSGRFETHFGHVMSIEERGGRTHVEYVCKLCNTQGSWDI